MKGATSGVKSRHGGSRCRQALAGTRGAHVLGLGRLVLERGRNRGEPGRLGRARVLPPPRNPQSSCRRRAPPCGAPRTPRLDVCTAPSRYFLTSWQRDTPSSSCRRVQACHAKSAGLWCTPLSTTEQPPEAQRHLRIPRCTAPRAPEGSTQGRPQATHARQGALARLHAGVACWPD